MMSIPLDVKKAAVLIPVIKENNHYEILLTIRTNTVEHHKGQISFPGGKHDPQDKNLLHTALRETKEEVGISSSFIEIKGELNPIYIPLSSFLVTPFVGLIHHRPKLILNKDEIEKELYVPVEHLFNPQNQKLEKLEVNGLRLTMKEFYYQGYRIWGATARMLDDFLKNFDSFFKEKK